MVTRDTRWPAGTPCWVDVSVDDVPQAIAFYQAMFGCDYQDMSGEGFKYAMLMVGGHEVGGSVVQPLRDSPYGRIGVVADDQGAVFSVITPPWRPGT